MLMSWVSKIFNSQSGVACIEASLALPLLISLAIGTSEISRMLSAYQGMSTISREVASVAFRDCATKPTGGPANTCLNTTMTSSGGINNWSSTVLPNATIIISIYVYGTASHAPELSGQYSSDPKIQSRFSPAIVASDIKSFRSAANPDGVKAVAISEIFYSFKPLSNYSAPFFDFAPREFYETTIF